MTQVRITMRTPLDGRVEVRGHSQAPVCAGISTLVCAVLNVLDGAAQNVVYESGNVCFDVRMTDSLQMGAFEVLCAAFEIISSAFPEEVGVTMVAPDEVC